MTGFEHLQVLISVVAGLALTNLLSGIGSTLKKHQPLYWIQCVWALNLAVFIVLFWWFTFTDFAGIESFHPFAYLFILVFAFSVYLPTRVLFPEPDEFVDLRSHFFANRRVFFRLMLFVVAVDICDTYIKHGLGYAAPGADWFEGIQRPWIAWILFQLCGHWQASRSESEVFHAGWALFYLASVLGWLTTLTPLGNA
jgi:hypothetical protein